MIKFEVTFEDGWADLDHGQVPNLGSQILEALRAGLSCQRIGVEQMADNDSHLFSRPLKSALGRAGTG